MKSKLYVLCACSFALLWQKVEIHNGKRSQELIITDKIITVKYSMTLMHVLGYVVVCICVCPPPGFHYPLYGKTADRDESEVTQPGRGAVVSSKQSGDSSSPSAIELLQQQSHQYRGKSPAVRHRLLHHHSSAAGTRIIPRFYTQKSV